MRVIGGTARGMKLHSPKGTEVRPMLDRVKEALFNILRDQSPGAEVLDLFAGTGSLGIEALSRGASHAVFVESDPVCIECIHRNLAHTRFEEKADIISRDAIRSIPAIEKRERRFDLVFVDPPYQMTATAAAIRPLETMLRKAAEKGLLSPRAVLMIHHGRRTFRISTDLPFEIFDERWYGQSGLALLRSKGNPRNGPMSERLVHNWMRLAEYDFETARAMMASARYLYVAFTCQQTIEKALKALYVKEKEATPPYSHNLLRIMEGLSVASLLSEQQKDLLAQLNSYYLESRYTEDATKLTRLLTKETSESLLHRTEELFQCLRAKL